MSSTTKLTRRESVNQALLSKLKDRNVTTKEKESQKDSPKTPKQGSIQDKTKGQSGEIKEPRNFPEFETFAQEVREFFKSCDEKLEKRLDKFDAKFTSVFEEIKKDMNSMRAEVTEVKTEMSELKSKVQDMEEAVEFQARMTEDRDDARGDLMRKYLEDLEELKTKILMQEKHDRKYNLLFYGFSEESKEDIEKKMKDFFKEKLEIPKDAVDKMTFANVHRNPSKAEGPRPIIVKFIKMTDRDLVFSKFLHPILRTERKRILSDLPTPMKKERGRLAKSAYTIRQTEKKQTRIVERGLSVFLEVREDKDQAWKRRHVPENKESDTETD